MTDEETQKLFTLLSQFYPNAKQLRSKDTQAAWRLALRDFAYADVKAQALSYAAREKFFPDLADLTGQLTPPPPPMSSAKAARLQRNILALKRMAQSGGEEAPG